jgi:hypothetical protein
MASLASDIIIGELFGKKRRPKGEKRGRGANAARED